MRRPARRSCGSAGRTDDEKAPSGRSADAGGRATALLGDMRIATPRGRAILSDLRAHEDVEVRRAAAEALAKIEAAGR